MVDFNDRRNTETSYNDLTPVAVRKVLDSHISARKNGGGSRLNIHYGDHESGQAWGDVESGYVGRSTGEKPIPLVVHNQRSMGGSGVLDKNIVKIESARKNRDGSRNVLWQHPRFQPVEGSHGSV